MTLYHCSAVDYQSLQVSLMFMLVLGIMPAACSDSSSVEIISWRDEDAKQSSSHVCGPQPATPQEKRMEGVHLPGCDQNSEPILPSSDGFKSIRELRLTLRSVLGRPGVATYLSDRKKQLGIGPETGLKRTNRRRDDDGNDIEDNDEEDEDQPTDDEESSQSTAERQGATTPSNLTTAALPPTIQINQTLGARPAEAGSGGDAGSVAGGDSTDTHGNHARDIDRELWDACTAGDAPAVRRALRKGASVRARDATAGNCTALHRAAVGG